jgi:acetylornithine deacetylase/succinyl-diaminopimelate desuccinylase-like protein
MRRLSRFSPVAAPAGAALLVAVLAAAAPAPAPDRLRAQVRAWRISRESQILGEFADLLRIPNIASDLPNIQRNAEKLAAMLRRRGLQVELLEGAGGPPGVLGEHRVPGARRTVLLYAHYDGQPVRPEAWTSAPWEPVLRSGPVEAGGMPVAWPVTGARFDPEWRLYARSASDDKAPIVGILAALDALAAGKVTPSVNLKVFLEGEEEAGSPHMAAFLDRHAARLAADLWLLLDGPVHPTRRMQVFFGARGVLDLEITAYGATRRLHSGHYGNWASNPALQIAHVVAGLRGEDGRILVRGFEEDIRPPTDGEERAAAEAPDAEEALARELGLASAVPGREGPSEGILRPSINVRGISAGDVGAAATNSIPTQATASIDFRLVPDQTPEKVRRRIEEHLKAEGYFLVTEPPDPETRSRHPRILRLEWGPGYPPARTSLDLPASRAVVRVLEEWAGGTIVRLPTLGGSVPMYHFAEKMRCPIIGVPIVNHDNNQHAADENVRLQNLWDGIEIYAALIARLGEVWKD